MAKNKNIANNTDVQAFLAAVQPQIRHDDANVFLNLTQEITGLSPARRL